MAENENEQEPEFNTDAGKVFSRDPGKSDIIQVLAERLGCTVDEICERLGMKRPDPTDSIDAADRYGVDVVGSDDEDDGFVCIHHLSEEERRKNYEEYKNSHPDCDEEDDEDEDDEDEDFSTGDGYLKDNHSDEYYQKRYDVSGRFEIHNENLYWAKRGKDNSEWTIKFMVDDFKIEDEAYFSIVAKLSNVTWTGAGEIENYTIDNIGVDEDEIEWAPSDEVVNRLVEDAKKLIKHLSIDSDGEVDLDW